MKVSKMGKRAPSSSSLASASKGKQPYAAKKVQGRKTASWRDKQRTCVFAGLRAMRAPSVRDPKTNEFYLCLSKCLFWKWEHPNLANLGIEPRIHPNDFSLLAKHMGIVWGMLVVQSFIHLINLLMIFSFSQDILG